MPPRVHGLRYHGVLTGGSSCRARAPRRHERRRSDLLHGLELDGDFDLLADEHAARLERRVPNEPELALIEGRLGEEPGPLASPRDPSSACGRG